VRLARSRGGFVRSTARVGENGTPTGVSSGAQNSPPDHLSQDDGEAIDDPAEASGAPMAGVS